MVELIAVINGDMLGTESAPGEYVDWNKPDIMTPAEWFEFIGCTVEQLAAESPHMIVWQV